MKVSVLDNGRVLISNHEEGDSVTCYVSLEELKKALEIKEEN